MPLHAFINENMEAILVEWEKFARDLPPGTQMDVPGLRDDAKEILETIAQGMTELQSEEEQEEKSKGEKHSNKAQAFAKKHSRKRHQEGFDFDQIVSEYRALRASVIRLWTDKMESADRDTLYQLTRFNEEIDQALTYAIKQYSEQVDRSQQSSLAAKTKNATALSLRCFGKPTCARMSFWPPWPMNCATPWHPFKRA